MFSQGRPPGPAPADKAALWRRVVFDAISVVVLVGCAMPEVLVSGDVDASTALMFLAMVPAGAAPLVLHRHRAAATRSLRSVVECATVVLAVGVFSYAVAEAIDVGDPFDGAVPAAMLLGFSMWAWFVAVPRSGDRLDDWLGHRFGSVGELPSRFVLAVGRWLLTLEVLFAMVFGVDRALEAQAVSSGELRAWTTLLASMGVSMVARWVLMRYTRTR